MSSLASRFSALRQQVSEKRSSAAVSPGRFTPSSQTSSQHRSIGEEEDDLIFPPIDDPVPVTPANPVVGQRRRRDSENDSNAGAIIRARQTQLDRDRAFAKERMKYHSLSGIQTEIDIMAFSANTIDQKLIEIRIVQEVEIKTMKAAFIAMTSLSKTTNSKLQACITAVITSPRIPLYVTGVHAALMQIAKHSPHLLSLPTGFDSSASTWVDTSKNISDYLISGRSAMRQKLQTDVDGGSSKPAKSVKGRMKKRSGRMALARLAAELFGKHGSIDSDSLARAALLRSLHRDHQKAVRDSQSPKKKKRQSVGSSVEVDGTPVDHEEPSGDVDSTSAQDVESGSEDALQIINSTDGEPMWGPLTFWTFVDYSFLALHKSIAAATEIQAEREQLFESFVTETIQSDFKEFPPSGTVEEDLELRASGLTRAYDRPEYLVQLEAAVFKVLKLTEK